MNGEGIDANEGEGESRGLHPSLPSQLWRHLQMSPLDREIELRAQKVTDPAVIAKRQAEMRSDYKEDVKTCLGKRVTDAIIACIKGAQTDDELDKCLR